MRYIGAAVVLLAFAAAGFLWVDDAGATFRRRDWGVGSWFAIGCLLILPVVAIAYFVAERRRTREWRRR